MERHALFRRSRSDSDLFAALDQKLFEDRGTSDEFTSVLFERSPPRAVLNKLEELSEPATQSLYARILDGLDKAWNTKKDHTLVLTFPPRKTIRELYHEIQKFIGSVCTLKYHWASDPFCQTQTLFVVQCHTKVDTTLTIYFIGLSINANPALFACEDFGQDTMIR